MECLTDARRRHPRRPRRRLCRPVKPRSGLEVVGWSGGATLPERIDVRVASSSRRRDSSCVRPPSTGSVRQWSPLLPSERQADTQPRHHQHQLARHSPRRSSVVLVWQTFFLVDNGGFRPDVRSQGPPHRTRRPSHSPATGSDQLRERARAGADPASQRSDATLSSHTLSICSVHAPTAAPTRCSCLLCSRRPPIILTSIASAASAAAPAGPSFPRE